MRAVGWRMASYDSVGPKERGWIAAGFLTLELPRLVDPIVLAPADGTAPLVLVPAGRDGFDRELVFGWARSELAEQRRGWLGALHILRGVGGRFPGESLAEAG